MFVKRSDILKQGEYTIDLLNNVNKNIDKQSKTKEKGKKYIENEGNNKIILVYKNYFKPHRKQHREVG